MLWCMDLRNGKARRSCVIVQRIVASVVNKSMIRIGHICIGLITNSAA